MFARMSVKRIVRTHWPAELILRALDLIGAGETDQAVANTTGIPAVTVRNYRQGRLPRRVRQALDGDEWCSGCGSAPHDFEALPTRPYSYLLAAYLGDGYVGPARHTTQLRFVLDRRYLGIVEEVCAAVDAIRGRRPKPFPDPHDACMHVVSAWKSWPCLLPQHGPGRKHQRKIELVPWQRRIVAAEPESFLRGLIHTDGWRGTNRVTAKGRTYAYPRYQFSNRSDDIRELFCATCDRLGIEWRPWGRWHVSIARRDSVALMDEFVGLKL
jgi:hypothetical protein